MFFRKFDSKLNLTFNDSILSGLPTLTHVYNTEQPTSKDPFWMEFSKPENPDIDDLGHGHGSIAFTRHTEKVLPDLVNQVHDYFKTIAPKFPWKRDRINVLRTRGYIIPHRDEPSARRTTINIGLKNSNCAETKFSNIDSLVDVDNTTNFIMEDGDVYMLDVFKVHSVHPIKPCDYRYLITYSMVTPFRQLYPIFEKA
jgi:hypothetical protein